MRKALIAFCLLVALAVGGIIAIHADVNEVRDQVVITEEVLYGDKSAAEGLTILAEAELNDGVLNWNTTYTIGEEPKTHTDFEYVDHRRTRPVDYEPSGLMLSDARNYHSSDWTRSGDGSGLSGLDLAYWELMQDTPVGEEGERIIRVIDYYDYYPLQPELELPNYFMNYWFGEINQSVSLEQQENMEQVFQNLTDYWKIPVLPSETMSINLSRRDESGVGGWGSGTGNGVRYDMMAHTTVTDNACYFVMNNRATDDRIMDFSHVPGGYGIHMISYEYNPTESGTMVDPDSLHMVYPLDEESRVLWLDHTEENDRLLLATLEGNGDTVLRVIECGSMKTLQELTIYEAEQYETFLVADCMDDIVLFRSNNGWTTLLEERDDGTYDVVIDIPVNEEQQASYGFHTVHWNGEKLVMACPLSQADWQSGDNCGFNVAVYDKNGALFVGKYTSSLDTKTYSYYSGDNCFLWNSNPLHISWK